MAAVEKGKDRGEKLELIESVIHNLRECMAGAELIGHMNGDVPIEDVQQALVITDAMAGIANRIEQNALCALQEILIEYQDWKELEEYAFWLKWKCRFNPMNSTSMPREAEEGGQA